MPNGFFGQNLQKKMPKTEKKHYRRILLIRNSLGTKFYLKMTIFK